MNKKDIKKIEIGPFNYKLNYFINQTMSLCMIILSSFLLIFIFAKVVKYQIFITIINFISQFSSITMIAFGILIIVLSISIIIKCTILKKPKYDKWLVDRLSQFKGNHIWYSGKYLYVEYNESWVFDLSKIISFIDSINSKSNDFTYYYCGCQEDENTFFIRVTEKLQLPDNIDFNLSKDSRWGHIPLGSVINTSSENDGLRNISWHIDYADEYFEKSLNKNKSSTIMILGDLEETSSIKNIIKSHSNKFKDSIELIDADENLDYYNMLELISNLEKSRNKLIDEYNVEDIYDCKDVPVDYYEINGICYQFDNMLDCYVLENNEKIYKKLDAETVYKMVSTGQFVEIID